MKIGILTFHMAHNCGAMLQAYALSKYINFNYNCDCEIIDYRLPVIYDKYEKILNSKKVEPKRIKFEMFINDYLPTSKRIFNIKDAEKYNIYIVGSDQIWNSEITNGYKDEYFAKFFPANSIRASYAASSGQVIKNIKEFSNRIKNFNYISVRENWLKEELCNFTDKQIYLCLDPVLMFDRIEWSNQYDYLFPYKDKKYILVYSFNITEEDYINILSLAKKYQLDVIELTTHKRKKFKEILYENNYGPFEWIDFVKNSEYIITDSYHCVLFSIIYNKPFRYIKDNDLRFLDIIERLHIEKSYNDFYISSNKTFTIIESEKYNSNIFLNKVIENVKDEKSEV